MTRPLGLAYIPAAGGLPGIEPRHMERLAAAVPALDWKLCRDKEEMASLLPNARVALVWAFSSSWNDRAGALEVISTPAAGRELIRAAPRPGLDIVFGSFHGELMAETLVGLILAQVRCIRMSMAIMHEQAWPRDIVGAAMRPLKGSRVVIVGFGHIGKWAGKLLKPFGVRLTGVNRTNLERPDYFDSGDEALPLSRLDEALPKADHLVVVLPGEASSAGVIDARRLGLLPEHAYVYNIGRGNAVDLEALTDLLLAGRLAGAGLDVFPEEPLPMDSRIRKCPTAILLPHVCAFAPNYFDLYLDELLPRLKKVNAGDPEE